MLPGMQGWETSGKESWDGESSAEARANKEEDTGFHIRIFEAFEKEFQ